MEKIDLLDVTFIIPVRVDSAERLENLELIIKYFLKEFDTQIIVLEADKEEKALFSNDIKKIYVEDHNPSFYRTKYLNFMSRQVETPFLAVWDADVILSPEQIEVAVTLLRRNEADMVIPYNGKFYDVPPVLKNVFNQRREMLSLEVNISKMNTIYGHFSVGGAFIVNKRTYQEAGMENENFYGWGPEDVERVKRWEILGCRVKRVEGPLFHLYHPRKTNSWFGSKELEIKNRGELLKVCRMAKNELTNYISTWIKDK